MPPGTCTISRLLRCPPRGRLQPFWCKGLQIAYLTTLLRAANVAELGQRLHKEGPGFISSTNQVQRSTLVRPELEGLKQEDQKFSITLSYIVSFGASLGYMETCLKEKHMERDGLGRWLGG